LDILDLDLVKLVSIGLLVVEEVLLVDLLTHKQKLVLVVVLMVHMEELEMVGEIRPLTMVTLP
jgi:hypothetical protein